MSHVEKSQVEEFTGVVRAKEHIGGSYFDIQIPPTTAKLLGLKKGTIVRVKVSIAKEPKDE